MEQKPSIYMHGAPWIEAGSLLPLLLQHRINCVVDCRSLSNEHIGQNTPENQLHAALRQHHIAYIPFFQHFGHFPPETGNGKGDILYRCNTRTPHFQKGLERIANGIKQGYTICVIDEVRDFYNSRLYNVIGRRLKELYHIVYLLSNGYHLTQEQIDQKQEEKAQQRRHRNAAMQALGRTGEEIAALYLSRSGYQILDHNWNLHHGCELDIVACKDGKLHFIEVKTRSSDRFGPPQSAISDKKMRHLLHAIRQYRHQRRFLDHDYQIDSIAIIYRADNDYDLNHFLGIHLHYGPCDEVIAYTQRPS